MDCIVGEDESLESRTRTVLHFSTSDEGSFLCTCGLSYSLLSCSSIFMVSLFTMHLKSGESSSHESLVPRNSPSSSAGAAVYSRLTLALYDFLILGYLEYICVALSDELDVVILLPPASQQVTSGHRRRNRVLPLICSSRPNLPNHTPRSQPTQPRCSNSSRRLRMQGAAVTA